MSEQILSLPLWEAEARDSGHLPPVNAENVRDPDYLIARLRDMLAVATRPDAEWVSSGRYVRLVADIQGLIDQIRPHGRAGSEMLATLTRAHPELMWTHIRNGFVGQPDWDHRNTDTAEICARRLRLPPDTTPHPWYRAAWSGVLEGWQVRVIDWVRS